MNNVDDDGDYETHNKWIHIGIVGWGFKWVVAVDLRSGLDEKNQLFLTWVESDILALVSFVKSGWQLKRAGGGRGKK